uniref:radial spoke head protein 9 homolog n=1 Tax=Myxine glutinosa TaxID=7769 RepID=UPI00358EBDB5
MELESLQFHLEHACVSGLGFGVEERTLLYSSLVVVQSEYRFHRVLLWGKVLGLVHDYYIALGLGPERLKKKKILFSTNGVDWHLLSPVPESLLESAANLQGRFQGNPSHEYQPPVVNNAAEDEEVKIKEEIRLAVVVAAIDEEVALAPRGAFIKTPIGQVIKNRSFEGLTIEEGVKLRSYMHLRELKLPSTMSLLQKSKLDPSIDFLDSIEKDFPKGCWSLQIEQGGRFAVLRSLHWIGLTFYHEMLAPNHGYAYIGFGEKNLDIAFMLSGSSTGCHVLAPQ